MSKPGLLACLYPRSSTFWIVLIALKCHVASLTDPCPFSMSLISRIKHHRSCHGHSRAVWNPALLLLIYPEASGSPSQGRCFCFCLDFAGSSLKSSTYCSETGPFSIDSLSHLWILSSLLFLIYRARICLSISYLALRVMDFWHQIELICLPFESLLEFAALLGSLCHRSHHLRICLPSRVLSDSVYHKRKPPLYLHPPPRVAPYPPQSLSALTPLLPVHSFPLLSLLCCPGPHSLIASPPPPQPILVLHLSEPLALPFLALWLVLLLFLCASLTVFCALDAFHSYLALCL